MKNNVELQIFDYSEINVGKNKTVKHYESDTVSLPFTNQLHISKDRGFAKSNPSLWLKVREGGCWSRKALSGLFKSKKESVFYGDIKTNGRRVHSFLVMFSEDRTSLRVFLFNFYTSDTDKLISMIQ